MSPWYNSMKSYIVITQLALVYLHAVKRFDVEDVDAATTVHESFIELIAINKRIDDQRVLSPMMCFPRVIWAVKGDGYIRPIQELGIARTMALISRRTAFLTLAG